MGPIFYVNKEGCTITFKVNLSQPESTWVDSNQFKPVWVDPSRSNPDQADSIQYQLIRLHSRDSSHYELI